MAEVKEKQSTGLLDQLKHILFQEEYISREQLEAELSELKARHDALDIELHDEEKLQALLQPIFERRTQYLQEHFPKLFKPMISASIQAHMKEAQDEVIDALYPMMGRMIRKFIQSEIEKLSERIDKQLDKTLSFGAFWGRIRAFFSGVKYEEMIIRDATTARLEEIFVINKSSGLLIGHHSVNNLMDADMVGGMLTGLKGFIEHAFQKNSQEIQMLEYESNKLIVHNFHTFYLASLVGGSIDHGFRDRLETEVNDFCEKSDFQTHGEMSKDKELKISEELKAHFNGFNEKAE